MTYLGLFGAPGIKSQMAQILYPECRFVSLNSDIRLAGPPTWRGHRGPKDHMKIKILQKAWFLESLLSWAFEPDCRILMFMRSFGPLSDVHKDTRGGMYGLCLVKPPGRATVQLDHMETCLNYYSKNEGAIALKDHLYLLPATLQG